MARSYRRYRNYNRRKASRWAANIQEVGSNLAAEPGLWSIAETIMSNPTQQNTYVSQTYTVKNFEINFVLEYPTADTGLDEIEDVTAYVMYAPQGMNITSDYNVQHPEYIMAYKFIGSPANDNSATGQQYQPYKIRTRLSRKLQTGDSVVLFIKGTNQTTANIQLRLSGLIRWWTKAN